MKFIVFFTKHPAIRYIFSGGTAAAVNLGLLYIFTDLLRVHYLASGVIAFCCAVVVSFILQKKWTFEDHSTHATHKKFAIFFVIAGINLVVNTGLLYLFTDVTHLHYMISQFLASSIVALWSYFIYKRMFRVESEVLTGE